MDAVVVGNMPNPVATASGMMVDITFCEVMESDPVEWNEECMQRLEEFISCMGPDELKNAGTRKDEVFQILNALGIKYGILQEISHLVRGASSAIIGDEDDDSDQQFSLSSSTIRMDSENDELILMAKIRKIALETLQKKSASNYLLKKALWLQNYERIKSIFESRVIKIISPPIFLTVISQPSRYNNSVAQIQERTSEQLNHIYGDLYFVTHNAETGMQKNPFLKRWLADDTKCTYMTCIFDPKGNIPCNFNTYVGLRASLLPPVKNRVQTDLSVQSIVNHVKEVFCNGNVQHTDYVLKWMANLVKYPWKKTEVLLLLFGIEGCGKSMVIDFFANMVLGTHLSFQTASPGVDVFGKFAVGTHRKLLCFCDEGGEELTKYQDALKNLITAKAVRVEKKGQDIRLEDNYTNVIVASNNAGPVKISSNDRRVVAFQCSEIYKDDLQYFANLADALSNDECARGFYDFLMEYDLDEDFPFQARRPVTAYYEALLVSSLPLIWRFWSYKCMQVGAGGGTGGEAKRTMQPARELHREFLQWKNERDYEAVYTESRFGRELNELVIIPNSGVIKVKRSTVFYEIQPETLKQFLIRKRKFDENAF